MNLSHDHSDVWLQRPFLFLNVANFVMFSNLVPCIHLTVKVNYMVNFLLKMNLVNNPMSIKTYIHCH